MVRYDYGGLVLIFLTKTRRVLVEGFSEYPYLLMLMKLWPRYWKNDLKRMNMNVDEYNGKALVMVNGRYQKVWRFSGN